MKISIFGVGYVGAVSSACFADLGHDVVAVDIMADKVAAIASGLSPIVEEGMAELMREGVAQGRITATTDTARAVMDTDLSLISVGTPSAPDGTANLTAVTAVLTEIGKALRKKSGHHSILMRSTVPPRTGEDIAIPLLAEFSGRIQGRDFSYFSNPEFLREGTAVRDFHKPPFTLIGAAAGDEAAAPRALYEAVKAPIHVVPLQVAEGAKYLANVFHAVKLSFANEAGQILAAYGIDAREAFRIFCEDRILNISPAYLRPGFAFGGSCLPKDVRSFLALARTRGVNAPFLEHIMPSNDAIIRRVFDAIAAKGRLPVALFGLAFKPGTDDLRESPFVQLSELLIGKGYQLRILDRNVNLANLLGTNRAYIEREIPHIEQLMGKSPQEVLRGSRVVVIGHVGAEDRAVLPGLLQNQHVIDLVGISELRDHPGITYQGLCW
jgi:GDP-mannose 6-dehydrogenase